MHATAMKINYYTAGYCRHLGCVVQSGAGLKPMQFPALTAHIQYDSSNWLFDTGYSKRFFMATQPFPERLYALTTPVRLNMPSLLEQLDPSQHIDNIFLSHLHADHIAGIQDFPEARLICSRLAWQQINAKTSRFDKVRQGLLPSLLPSDFTKRLHFIEDFPLIDLPIWMQPFTQGYQLDKALIAVALPGHAAGHYGLLANQVFFIADAVWQFASIAHNKLPSRLTHLLLDDIDSYYETIKRLQALHRNNPELLLLPSHCQASIARAINKSHKLNETEVIS